MKLFCLYTMRTIFSVIAFFTFVSGLTGYAPQMSSVVTGPLPPNCEAKVPRDYVTIGNFYGTIIRDLPTNNYDVIIGEYVEAVYISKEMSVLNETFTIVDGNTGTIKTGWRWFMEEGTTLYTMSDENGSVKGCETTTGNPVDTFTGLIGTLRTVPTNTIHPTPTSLTPPPPPKMCQGVCKPTLRYPERVTTLGWESGTPTDTPLFITVHSKPINVRMDVHGLRPLNTHTDFPNLFNNPCKGPSPTPPPPMKFGSLPARFTVRL